MSSPPKPVIPAIRKIFEEEPEKVEAPDGSNTVLVVLDTETTGVNPNSAHVVELGITRVKYDEAERKSIERAVWLVRPPIAIPAGATNVHHITDELVADAPAAEELTEEVMPMIEGASIIAAHNLPYDKKIVERDFAEVFTIDGGSGVRTPRIPRGLDTLRLARRQWPQAPNHQLQTLREHLELGTTEEIIEAVEEYLPGLGEDDTGEHRAMFDVEVTLRMIEQALLPIYGTVARMADSLRQPVKLGHMPFGKHVGVPIEQLGVSYVNWLRRQPWLKTDHPDLFFTLETW